MTVSNNFMGQPGKMLYSYLKVVFKIIEVGLNGNLGALNFESPLTVCEGLGMTSIWSSCDMMSSSVLNF